MLSEIIDQVHARLADLGIEAAQAIGGDKVHANGSPPRIVWVPLGGPGGSARQPGEVPRRLRTRNVAVDAHVWGADLAATELLLNDLVAAVHHVTHGSYGFNNETWPDGNNETLARGRVVVANITFAIPIVERLGTDLVTIASVSQTVDENP